ncbi:cytidine deaminase [Pleomorphomonas diazotrophica]|uniref:Cytidine deaminase n=1 Tax=Pleomorphomonas diazotrophica TaxID=1166257 RepID=A0A1I4RS57_9HYPH|nr:cytidine deaminase [Pleomorphomonas diazotrophica]PKR88099.1 cytidine deaminase [Pleomorphomonas diazotrophica]SFM54823.1 cytidine deaminase [Pleomorphomonas diazotrophica]
MDDFHRLFTAASAARAKAHAPYSNYAVGAALLADDGNIYAGCNVENAAFPEGWCAETTAIGHLVMGGAKRIVSAVVVASRIDGERVPGGRFCTPCGGCRQRLSEFAASPATEIWAADPEGASQRFTMAELLPAGFVLEE